jgi:hypothetical protein
MRSFLFTDGKAPTSYGRGTRKKRPPNEVSANTSSKKARQIATQENGGGVNDDEEYDMLMSTTTSITGGTTQQLPVTRGMLSTTIAILKHESVEKELQKANHLEVRILLDKLAAVQRKYNHVSKRYYGMITMQQQSQEHGGSRFLLDMEREMNVYQKQMSEVEVELEQLQRSEIERRGQAIAVLRVGVIWRIWPVSGS